MYDPKLFEGLPQEERLFYFIREGRAKVFNGNLREAKFRLILVYICFDAVGL